MAAPLLLALLVKAVRRDGPCSWPSRDETHPTGRRVLVYVNCDGLHCEETLGGARIWGTNLGQSLAMLGYDVAFGRECMQTGADVVIMPASHVGRHSPRSHSKQLQVATKVNNVHPGEVALTDVVVVGSWLHGHSNHAISGWSFAQKTLVLKHVEVPTGCCGPCRWVADPIFTSRCTGRGLSLRLALPHCATTGMPTTSCWQQICTPASVGLLSKPGYT